MEGTLSLILRGVCGRICRNAYPFVFAVLLGWPLCWIRLVPSRLDIVVLLLALLLDCTSVVCSPSLSCDTCQGGRGGRSGFLEAEDTRNHSKNGPRQPATAYEHSIISSRFGANAAPVSAPLSVLWALPLCLVLLRHNRICIFVFFPRVPEPSATLSTHAQAATRAVSAAVVSKPADGCGTIPQSERLCKVLPKVMEMAIKGVKNLDEQVSTYLPKSDITSQDPRASFPAEAPYVFHGCEGTHGRKGWVVLEVPQHLVGT